MDKVDLQVRTKRSALDVIDFCQALPRHGAAGVIAKQLLRSGTSVGANYRGACQARSRADFVAKMGIVAEEADESQYWMELLSEGKLSSAASLDALLREARELTAIAVSSINTARGQRGPFPNSKFPIPNGIRSSK